MRRVDGVLFDLGDTLLNFGSVDLRRMFRIGTRRAYEYLQQAGQPLPRFRRFHRRQLRWVRWSYFKSFLTRREFNSLDLIARLARSWGHDLTDEQVRQLAWLWYEPLTEVATVDHGARELLAEFRQAGLTLGVVSNTFVPACVLDRHLAQHGLLELLPHRIYSCDVGYRKPHPRIFRHALEQTGLQAERTLFVGDLPKADIGGANRVGMISVLKDPTGTFRRFADQADHCIGHLSELREIVARYNPQPV